MCVFFFCFFFPPFFQTSQIPPLRVERGWYAEDPADINNAVNQIPDSLKEEMASKIEKSSRKYGRHYRQRAKVPSNFTIPFSKFESHLGRHADPLYSKHETTPRKSGVDPSNPDYVFVDPHVLTTPLLSDTDGDGIYAELVIPVSYYFDPHHYGDPHNLYDLNGLGIDNLVNYVGGGVVIIDLRSGKIIGQRLLGLTRATDSQPSYIMATPTVVRLSEGEAPVVIIGTTMGGLHILSGITLEDRPKFPLDVDSITAQVAVGDILGNGKLDLVVGDYSGNVYCVGGDGVRVWERELEDRISAAIRLVDVDGDGMVEVVVVSNNGGIWVLDGHTGKDAIPGIFPVHLNTGVERPVLPIHMINRGLGPPGEKGGGGKDEISGRRGEEVSLAVVLGTANGLYVVDTKDGCVHHIPVPVHVIHEVLSGDIDPYNPGLELVTVGLDGALTCFKTTVGSHALEKESWSMEPSGPSFFAHRESSFYFSINSSSEVTGKTFSLGLTLHANMLKKEASYDVTVSIGMKHLLHSEKVMVQRRETEFALNLPCPPTPLLSFLTVRVCNQFQQCQSKYVHMRFNLHFEDHLRWFLCFPFLSLCAAILWLHRGGESALSLPTSSSLPSKRASGTKKDY